MTTASKEEIICGIIAVAIFIAIFYLFDNFAKSYDKKHPNEKGVSGHYKTTKAGYHFTRGEYIYHRIFFFIVAPVYIIIVLYIWDRLFR